MSHHTQGQGIHQVTEDNPVRVIDVFVDGTDLSKLGFKRVQAKHTGRPVLPHSDVT